MQNKKTYDVIVVGGGHAAIEAALSAARTNLSTLMLVLDLDSIGWLACNPSIGGTAKGHLVKEVDALGGQMALEADKALVQLKMLNSSKGVAVQSLRSQIDKKRYHANIKNTLENTPNLYLRQAEVSEILLTCDKRIKGVKTSLDLEFFSSVVIIATGVYLKSSIIIGDKILDAGPAGFAASKSLSSSIIKSGHTLRRFKTGTPPRIKGSTVDYSKLERCDGEKTMPFSYLSDEVNYNAMPCYLGYTNKTTHQIIRDNLHLSPLYAGLIKGTGARYCPSIEDKIVRFGSKERHQFFLEPEGSDTQEVYVQGISTSLPPDVQAKILHSIEGLENVEIMRDAYAIEYDCIDPSTLKPTLESKIIKGLYFAGQVNGTSGYEEAAAQGIMAGINASLCLKNKPPLVLKRSEAYIGVLIDDLVTKGTNEPYRMMTSRAEHRLRLRQSNSDLRLTPYAIQCGLASPERVLRFDKKQSALKDLNSKLTDMVSAKSVGKVLNIANAPSLTLKDLFKRDADPVSCKEHIDILQGFSMDVIEEAAADCRYEGYLKRADRAIEEANRLEDIVIPENFDYLSQPNLRIEARQKLDKVRPLSLGQAARISGVNPADINVLLLLLHGRN